MYLSKYKNTNTTTSNWPRPTGLGQKTNTHIPPHINNKDKYPKTINRKYQKIKNLYRTQKYNNNNNTSFIHHTSKNHIKNKTHIIHPYQKPTTTIKLIRLQTTTLGQNTQNIIPPHVSNKHAHFKPTYTNIKKTNKHNNKTTYGIQHHKSKSYSKNNAKKKITNRKKLPPYIKPRGTGLPASTTKHTQQYHPIKTMK